MRSFLSSVRVVAAKEFRDCWRNLWLIVGSALFACLSLAVVFGTAAIGGDFSFRPLEAVMTSVVTLGVFLIPLIAVLISYDAFVGEQEHGTLILLLTYPLSRPGAFNRQTSRAKCCTRRLPASWFFRIAAPYGIKCSALRPHKT